MMLFHTDMVDTLLIMMTMERIMIVTTMTIITNSYVFR